MSLGAHAPLAVNPALAVFRNEWQAELLQRPRQQQVVEEEEEATEEAGWEESQRALEAGLRPEPRLVGQYHTVCEEEVEECLQGRPGTSFTLIFSPFSFLFY
jgi:hypothetical protein